MIHFQLKQGKGILPSAKEHQIHQAPFTRRGWQGEAFLPCFYAVNWLQRAVP